MLRLKFFLIVFFLVLTVFIALSPGRVLSTSSLRRLTNTSEESLNLNPMLSDDGEVLAFESTADLAAAGGTTTFRAFRARLTSDSHELVEVARTRAVAPTMSSNGQLIAFASTEDLLQENSDRNSEIYLYDGSILRQVTHTSPDTEPSRLLDGNFQPSISGSGRWITFSSNRSITGTDPVTNAQIYLFDNATGEFSKLTSAEGSLADAQPKISADGSRIFYVRSNQDVSRADLMLHDKTSGETRVLVAKVPALTLGDGRVTSSDGMRIVYSSQVGENDNELFIYDLQSNSARQLTSLGARSTDVKLAATISGDGKRVAFATRRKVLSTSDGGVELYLLDIPTSQVKQVTNAPSSATAEVVSSLNFDGSLVTFSFPRVLSGPASANELANNSEIYVASLEPRPASGSAIVLNGAAKGNEPNQLTQSAPESIVSVVGSGLSFETVQAKLSNAQAPTVLAGTTATIQGRRAQILYVSPSEITIVLPASLSPGLTELVITNSEEFASTALANILPAAPGVFAAGGTGRGEAIAIDSDTFVPGPFDPSDGHLRLAIFTTGCRNARNLAATVDGQQIAVESVSISSTLPGLDEVRLTIPSDLRGLGSTTLVLSADGIESNATTLQLSGSSLRDIVINEILADPPDGLSGDANNDGRRDASADEFIELVNSTTRDLDIGGYRLETRAADNTNVLRHRFPTGTFLAAGTAIVVFGGGNPSIEDPAFGGSQVVKSSTGSLSLNNTAGTILLRDSSSELITQVTYGGATGLPANLNQSLTRHPDVTGSFVIHSEAAEVQTRLFSPGTRSNLVPFSPLPAVTRVVITPATLDLQIGSNAKLMARAFDQNDQELKDVIFRWSTSAPAIAEVDQVGEVKAIAPGIAEIVATARNVRSAPSLVKVESRTPTPTPSPSPSATATPLPTTTPTPSPSPTPIPSPFPSPTPSLPVVISEFRTRGPNGANDEFIELYNNSDSPVSIAGWKLRGSNNSGSISTRLTIAGGTTIPAHCHFLATHTGYSGAVAGDQLYSSGITNDGGIALTLPDDSIVDQIGLSTGSAFREGTHLAPLASDADVSYERRPGGSVGSGQDTNDNFTDFVFLTPSQPQNLSSVPAPGPDPSPSPSPTPSASPLPSPSPSTSRGIVISQIFGGGGNSGAPFRNDFIEIFNNSPAVVNLDSWSVQYASANASTWAVTNLASISLNPGQYYLIQEGPTGANGIELPAPDTIGSITMAATAGKVALVNSQSALSGACPNSQTIVDFVGYGTTANCFQGTGPTPSPGNITAVLRGASGCTDSQNNPTDFIAGPPNPRNRSSMLNPCSIVWKYFYFRHREHLPESVERMFRLTARSRIYNQIVS